MRNIAHIIESSVGSAMMPSMHLMPHWISRLFEDWEKEEEDNAWSVTLLRNESRKATWVISGWLGVDSRGVPGQACSLLERYLTVQTRIYNEFILDEQRQRFKNHLTKNFALFTVSCIQLAAKMNSADFRMNAMFVRACLALKGIRLSVAQINDAELRVYSALEFRVPLWTSVDAAEMMAVELGMPGDFLECVALLVNVAEYKRDRLDKCVRWAANLSPACTKFMRTSLRTLHLIAGSVAATARYLSYKGPDPAPRLAELTRAPLCYIRCVSDCIVSTVNAEQMVATPEKSRKRARKEM